MKPEQFETFADNILNGLWFVIADPDEALYLHRDLVLRQGTVRNREWSLKIWSKEGIPSYVEIDAYTGYFLTEQQALDAIKDYNDN